MDITSERPATALASAVTDYSFVYNPYSLRVIAPKYPFIGDVNSQSDGVLRAWSLYNTPTSYADEIDQCRFFYRNNPTASTVIDRMAELASGAIRLRKGKCSDKELAYFKNVVALLSKFMRDASSEYLITGMVVPAFTTQRSMGNKYDPLLGRTRYVFPQNIWARNPKNIVLKRSPIGNERRVFMRVPQDEVYFLQNNGKYADGTEDVALYQTMLRDYPQYVADVKANKTEFLLERTKPIFRKLSPDTVYPQPFLISALAALKHKMRIQEMDHTIATRAIEAIMHVKAGNDEYPVVEGDPNLTSIKNQLKARSNDATQQLLYKLFTNHTVTIDWIYPPLDALLSTTKYDAVDADIFMAMGFSRVLLVGENNKSNAGSGITSILGPLAMLNEMRASILDWIVWFFEVLADLNGFANIPTAYFAKLMLSDDDQLLSAAKDAFDRSVISRNTYAQMFGTDFDTEQEQSTYESGFTIVNNTPEPTQPAGTAPSGV